MFEDSLPDAQQKAFWVASINESGAESPRVRATALMVAYPATPTPQVQIPVLSPVLGDMTLAAVANGLTLTFGVVPQTGGASVKQAKLRVKRVADGVATPATMDLRNTAEGGADSGLFQFNGIPANQYGARFVHTFEKPGRYFFSWALENEAGWSDWSSGDLYATGPQNVPDEHSVSTVDNIDDGPPFYTTVTTQAGADGNSVTVKLTRPTEHGKNLMWCIVILKNSGTGSWLPIDTTTSPGAVYYDGSAVAHKMNDAGMRIYRESGTGFGSAVAGHLCLLDVRGGAFNRNYCQWGVVTAVGSNYIDIQGGFRPKAFADLRIKIVKPIWAWATGGYLGVAGYWGKWIAGDNADSWTSDPIKVDSSIASVDAQVYFENTYSRSDCSATSTPSHSSNAVVVAKGINNTGVLGSPIKTASSGARVEFDPTFGIKGFNSSDSMVTQIDCGNGLLTMKSATSGARVEISGAAGTITAYDGTGLHTQLSGTCLATKYIETLADDSYLLVFNAGGTGGQGIAFYPKTQAVRAGIYNGVDADLVLSSSNTGLIKFNVNSTTNWGSVSGSGMNLASGLVYTINATQVVGARKTGWGAPTGTATRTTFATDTVTLIELARRMKGLIDDLTSHGLIGA
jgi:hypothetical protein